MRLCGGGQRLDRLTRRPDFLRAASGRRFHSETLTIQGFRRPDDAGLRVGFTLTRKVGHATERNRIRRRLRAAALQALPPFSHQPLDIVVVGRIAAISAPFELLVADLGRGLAAVLKPRGDKPRRAPAPPASDAAIPPTQGPEPETHA